MWRTVAATLGLAGLASLAPAQPRTPQRTPVPAQREVSVPFRVGETLTYDVAWSTYLIAGTAVTTVVEKKPSYGSTAYYIVAEGRPLPLIARLYALYYKMDTLLDTVTGLSQRTSLYTEEGPRHRTATTRFDRTSRRALFELQAEGAARDEFAIPADVQDGLATLYMLRTRTFRAGERLTIPVADDGMLYSVSVEATGPERLKMRLGEFDAWNLQVTVLDAERQQVGKNMAVWMSTDSRRLPLRIQADLPVGYFVLALKEAR
jgi:hypothetical protein